ncbi:MAG: MerR family DNA-binding protein [Terriglobia bacterium]
MHEALAITALAKRTGIRSKTLRYWESLGLLPRAVRTRSGYRMFDPESVRYVAFIRKAKAIGLTLAEMREVLRLARTGQCPCPEVLRWTDARVRTLDEQIRALTSLRRRLKRIQRQWPQAACSEDQCGDICTLIDGLPEFTKGDQTHAKVLDGSCQRRDRAGCDCRTGGRVAY